MSILYTNLLFLSFLVFACSSEKENKSLKERPDTLPNAHPASVEDVKQSGPLLSQYDLDGAAVLPLPGELEEVSGLAVAPDGRLFAHNDEQGIVFRLDPQTGAVLERFSLGSVGVQDDFEGIEVVGERFFLLNSKGTLYEFREGEDRAHVDFTAIKTGLKGKNDLEGLCYDSATNALLLVCKEYPGKGYVEEDEKTVYALSLSDMKLKPEPRFVIPAKEIRKKLGVKNFKPSGIARHPESGSFFILSSNTPSIIELSPQGTLLAVRPLPGTYKQPEGIAFAADGRLYIASEGGRLFVAKNY